MECDFCGEPDPSETVRAISFVSHTAVLVHGRGYIPLNVSEGDWAACPPCAALLRANKWDDLIERSASRFEDVYGNLPTGMLRDYLRALYAELKEALL